MRKVKVFFTIVFIFVLTSVKGYSQFIVDATALVNSVPATNDTAHLCIGDTLKLSSTGSPNFLMNNNFNNASLGTGWSSNIVPLFSNPCPPTLLPAQGTVVWFGGSIFPRELITVSYNIAAYQSIAGCKIEWDMCYAAQQNAIDCESPDLPDEGVHLQYTTTPTGPYTWTQFNGEVSPTGTYGTPGYTPGSGGYWTPVPGNAATGSYYTWNHYSTNIPNSLVPNPYSTTTRFRWYQVTASNPNADHWGIDNVAITCQVNPYISWSCPERPSFQYTGFNPPPFVYNQAGTYHYIVLLLDLNTGINVSDTIVTIVHNPKVNAGLDTNICLGDSIQLKAIPTGISPFTYKWTIPTSDSSNQNIYVHPINTTNYIVTISDNKNCKSKDTVKVMVNPLPQIAVNNDTICIGKTAALNASGGSVYYWNNGATTNSISVSPTVTTNFNVVVTTVFGCKDSAIAKVIVNPLPTIQLSNDTTICAGSNVNLTASGGAHYLWSPTGDSTASITVSPLNITSYNVVVTDINFCVDNKTVTVNSTPIPIPIIYLSTDTICKGAVTTITAEGGTIYHWNSGESTATITVEPHQSTTYNVTISNSVNGVVCSANIGITQEVRNCNSIYIPNAFYPYGYNTIFKPVGKLVNTVEYSFQIWDKWGKLIFETTNPDLGWDGKYNGIMLNSGVYVYRLRMDNKIDAVYEKIGTVTLIQ